MGQGQGHGNAFGRTRRVRAYVAALVGVILFVPALVRATQSLGSGTKPALFRLNRTFQVPKAKCQIAPPSSRLAEVVSPIRTLPLPRAHGLVALVDAIPVPPPDIPLTGLRAPPATPLV